MDNIDNWEIIAAKLKENGFGDYKCPICKNEGFTLDNKFVSLVTNDEFYKIKLNSHIPSAVVICNKCGHIELFALKAFGVIPKEEK